MSKEYDIAVLVSGGVDSSVALYLALQTGKKVVAYHAICFNDDSPFCTSQEDKESAIRICAKLSVPLKILDLSKEYESAIINSLVSDYEKGKTPNPDILCNTYIKFGVLSSLIWSEFPEIVIYSGHYASILNLDGENFIKRAADSTKDQSYFLYNISDQALGRLHLPLGDLLKSEVRQLAQQFHLHTANKKDSQGLCFVGNVSMKEFLKRYLPITRGKVLDKGGKAIGEHDGAHFYTLGQRHGFSHNESNKILYVTAKDIDNNTLTIGNIEDCYVSDCCAKLLKMTSLFEDGGSYECRIRHLGELTPAKVFVRGYELIIAFDAPVFALSTGQHVVVYNKEGLIVAGGEVV